MFNEYLNFTDIEISVLLLLDFQKIGPTLNDRS